MASAAYQLIRSGGAAPARMIKGLFWSHRGDN
jgi:hypothetical protein